MKLTKDDIEKFNYDLKSVSWGCSECVVELDYDYYIKLSKVREVVKELKDKVKCRCVIDHPHNCDKHWYEKNIDELFGEVME